MQTTINCHSISPCTARWRLCTMNVYCCSSSWVAAFVPLPIKQNYASSYFPYAARASSLATYSQRRSQSVWIMTPTMTAKMPAIIEWILCPEFTRQIDVSSRPSHQCAKRPSLRGSKSLLTSPRSARLRVSLGWPFCAKELVLSRLK